MDAFNVVEAYVFYLLSLVMFRWRGDNAHLSAGATHYNTLLYFTGNPFPFMLRKRNIDVSAAWSKKLILAIWLRVITGDAISVTETLK